MSIRIVLATLALALGLITVMGSATAYAADDDHHPAMVDGSPQTDAVADEDNALWVQGWTLVAAGGAAAVGLLALMARVVMGWVEPPPPPREEDAH